MNFQTICFIFHVHCVVLVNLTRAFSGEPLLDGDQRNTGDANFVSHQDSVKSICKNSYTEAKYSLIGAAIAEDRRKFTCFSPTPIKWNVEFEYAEYMNGEKSTLNPACNFDLKHLKLNYSQGTKGHYAAIIGCTNQAVAQSLNLRLTWSKLTKARKVPTESGIIKQCSSMKTVESDMFHGRFKCKSGIYWEAVSLTSCQDWTNCMALVNFIIKDPCQRTLRDSSDSTCWNDPTSFCKILDTEKVYGILTCYLMDHHNSFLPFFRHNGVFVSLPSKLETLNDYTVLKLGISVTQVNMSKTNEVTEIWLNCSAPKFIAVPGFRWTFVFNGDGSVEGKDVCPGLEKTPKNNTDSAYYTDVCRCKRCETLATRVLVTCNVLLQTGHSVTVNTTLNPHLTIPVTTLPQSSLPAPVTKPAVSPGIPGSASTSPAYSASAARTVGNFPKNASSTEKMPELLTNDKNKFPVIIFGAGVGVCFLLLLPILLICWRKIGRQRNALQISKEVHDNFIQGCEMMNTLAPNKRQHAMVLPYDYNLEIPREKIKMDSRPVVLGEGAFGKVVKASIAGRFVAIKTCKPTPDGQPLKALLSELKIMTFVGKHPNIVEFLGANTEKLKKQDVWMIFEFCENGNALHYIRGHRDIFVNLLSEDLLSYKHMPSVNVEYANAATKKLSNEDLVRWSYEVACGMDYIASKNVYHGDLAARNILLTRDLVAKVGDFGLAKQLTNYSLYVQRIECPLPLKWLSIEALRDLEFSIQSDVWSFGIAIWELFSLGSTPYPGMDWNFQAWKKLQDGERMDRPEGATLSIYGILTKCWETLPQDRPTFADVKDMFRHELDNIGGRGKSSFLC